MKVTARMESGATPRSSNEIGDAVRDDARLARAGAGKDQHRAVDGFDGLALLRDSVCRVNAAIGRSHLLS